MTYNAPSAPASPHGSSMTFRNLLISFFRPLTFDELVPPKERARDWHEMMRGVNRDASKMFRESVDQLFKENNIVSKSVPSRPNTKHQSPPPFSHKR